jgi:hypothetical protein
MWRSRLGVVDGNGICFLNATLQIGYRVRRKSINAGWSLQRLRGLLSSASVHLAKALAFISKSISA